MAAILQIVSPDELTSREESEASARQQAEERPEYVDDLQNYIRQQWEIARNHRSSSGLEGRLLSAMRAFNGVYDSTTLAEIREYGGSEVYARIISAKARAATALLRDVFMAEDRPWALSPTPDPTLPDDMADAVDKVLTAEIRTIMQGGGEITQEMIMKRRRELERAAQSDELRRAHDEAEHSEVILDDYLKEGGFYQALVDILIDLPLFPFVCLKGPSVRSVPTLKWVDKKPVLKTIPRLFWQRVSPFDIMWTPGVSRIEDADMMERLRWTRRNLHDLLDLPGWNQSAVKAVLREYDAGLRDWMMPSDSQRAVGEDREDPNFNQSNMIDALEFHGSIPGKYLKSWGMENIENPDRDYFVQAWVCGRYVLKVTMAPSPRKRHPYCITAFDKVPGNPVGNALPDILDDVQQVANAALRALVNNMSMSSGPQVVVMRNRLAPGEDGDEIFPWKRWHMEDEMGQQTIKPVDFFQPQSNAQELLGVYDAMTKIADELSALPRYITGSGATGGAGRTASGLSMLLGNANKVLHNVVSNVDVDVIHPTLQGLFDLVMLSRPDALRGDEHIVTRGVATAMAREAERARQLEFLGITANPIDMQITGLEGRATVLREVAKGIGIDGESVVPSKEEMQNRQQQMLQAQSAQAAAEAQGDQAPAPAEGTGPRTNVVQPGAGGNM